MSTTGTLQITETYNVHCCSSCGVAYAISDAYDDRRREDHATFWCPNGHGQSYSQKTEAEKQRERADRLQQQLKRRESDLQSERNSHRSTRGELTKVKKRVSHGVCPCCNRTFKQVDAHMKRMHPEFVDANG